MHIKLDKNDILFSKMIRERDGNKCCWCPKQASDGWKMTCSHFWGRSDKIHRFDPLNCDTLCFYCHEQNESNKQGFYSKWKRQQLGKKIYDIMYKRHYQETKKYGQFEKDKLYQILKKQYDNNEHLKKDWRVDW